MQNVLFKAIEQFADDDGDEDDESQFLSARLPDFGVSFRTDFSGVTGSAADDDDDVTDPALSHVEDLDEVELLQKLEQGRHRMEQVYLNSDH